MGLIFNRGDDNDERIKELEDELATSRRRISKLEDKIGELPQFMEHVQEVREKYDITDQKLPEYKLEDHMYGRRITLDKPRVAWKHADEKVIKLLLTKGTTVVYPQGQGPHWAPKLRADKAIPVEIQEPDGSIAPYKTVTSDWDSSFTYELGERAEPDKSQIFGNPPFEEYAGFDPRTDVTCSGGIHLYRTRQEAVRMMMR
jgi:hypothetical protein